MQKGAEAMHRFDYSFLDNGMLPAGLLNITTDIYSPGFVHEKKSPILEPAIYWPSFPLNVRFPLLYLSKSHDFA